MNYLPSQIHAHPTPTLLQLTPLRFILSFSLLQYDEKISVSAKEREKLKVKAEKAKVRLKPSMVNSLTATC